MIFRKANLLMGDDRVVIRDAAKAIIESHG
jgi:hypothetical protein